MPRSKKGVSRSALIVLVSAISAAAAVALAPHYGLQPALETLVLLVVLGCAALTIAHGLARRRRRLGALRRQFHLGIAVAVGQMLIAVVGIAALMFVSEENALMLAVIVAFAGAIAWRAAQLITVGVLRDIEMVRDALIAVGHGARDVHIETTSRDELAELAAEATAMVEQLSAEETARRNLVAGVSHDLRTPITSLRLLAEAVGDDIVDDHTRRRYLDTITTHVRALSALIDDLFELSRLEAGDISWSVERVALDELVGEAIAAMAVEAEARGIRVTAEIPDDLAPAEANPEKLQRVLFNLIENAIRHTPADGSVTVRAQPKDVWLEIEVADTGRGINATEREQVFDPFYRAGPDATRTSGGAGLGLAISRAIVEAHGGRIWLEPNREASGTRVRFLLPRADPDFASAG